MRAAGGLVGWVLAAAACGHESGTSAEATTVKDAPLGGDVAARVGPSSIPMSLIASVAQRQQISGREAARKIIDDEVAAAAARARGLDRTEPAGWQLVAARGRFASDRLFEEARARGLPNDDEVARLTDRHWAEVDRPPSVHVVHAIVLLREKNPSPAQKARARAFADELHAVLVGASAEDFEAKAKALPRPDSKLDLRVERLPAFTVAGWVTEGGGRMDEAFARAAFALSAIGDTSGVVETGFGLHVIRLLERLPEKRMPLDLRRLAFAEEVYSLRASELVAARLKALRATHPVTLSPGAEALMRSVGLSSTDGPEAP